MQIFKLILNLLSAVGIEARDPAQDHSLNWKSVMAFFLLSKYALLTVVAVCLEDKTFSEYAEFIYSFLTSIAVVNNVSIALVTMKSLYILVVKIEDTIANRKYICFTFLRLYRRATKYSVIFWIFKER